MHRSILHRSIPLLVAAWFITSALAARAAEPFECRWAAGKVTLDGQADEEAWKAAQVIDQFGLPWLGEKARPPRTKTSARLLWDRDYLYFFAEMEDGDLYADITEHDGQTWYNDVFELFFKPAENKPGYYEFQVSPAGTLLDCFMPRRGAGGFRRFGRDGEFHIEAKVRLDGTLNRWQDDDTGWSVEGRLPWTDLLRTGGRPNVGETWKFALCRYDYSVDFEGPELSTCAPLASKKNPDFHHYEDYAPLKFVGPKESRASGGRDEGRGARGEGRGARGEDRRLSGLTSPARLGSEDPVFPFDIDAYTPVTTSTVKGSPEPPLPYRLVRAYPELDVDFPIFVTTQPGTRRLIFIDQHRPYSETRVCRTRTDPAESGDYDVLLELSDTAYDICFHPDFAENGFLYVGSNGAAEEGQPKRTRVVRYTMQTRPPYKFDPATAVEIISWESDGHNGGALDFGTDGMLYVTSGDGTSDSDTDLTGQRMDLLLAKVLRIDVDRPADPSNGKMYSVPEDNPFVGREGIRPETWAYGLRNPWRLAVDPRLGHVWVTQNGQDLWEQVYLAGPGENYGWSVYEGSHPFYLNRQLGPTPHVKPTFEHHHTEARSLTGGFVYHGQKLPDLRGAYVYGDYSTGRVWAGKADADGRILWHKEIADGPLQITDFGPDPDGEVLVCDHQKGGGFYRLEPNPASSKPAAGSNGSNGSNGFKKFPRTLSASGLFRSVAGHEMQPGAIPYSVNAPLWSDGAIKARWLVLPPPADGEDAEKAQTPITLQHRRGWDLPEATVLVKSFALELTEGDPESRRWVETRFFTKQQGEWAGYSYRWNAEQTEATLVPKEGRDETFAIRTAEGVREQPWRYPSRTECMVCHSRAANFVLGLQTPQMNKPHDYGTTTANQLEVLAHLGLLQVNYATEIRQRLREQFAEQELSPAEIDKRFNEATATNGQRALPGTSTLLSHDPVHYPHLADPYDESADLTERAKSYLHANCAQCHVEAGGGNAQMQLAWHTPLEKMNIVGVRPLHHTFGLPDARLIAPGDPERSVLLHRMAVRGRGQMPQLATCRVDERAVAMMRKWIEQLDPLPATAE